MGLNCFIKKVILPAMANDAADEYNGLNKVD